MMKGGKQYAIFALLLPCIVALDLGMDYLLHLPQEQIMRNLLFPFQMLDPIEKSILAILILLFIGSPLFALFGKRGSGPKGRQPSGGSGGTPSAPEQPDQH